MYYGSLNPESIAIDWMKECSYILCGMLFIYKAKKLWIYTTREMNWFCTIVMCVCVPQIGKIVFQKVQSNERKFLGVYSWFIYISIWMWPLITEKGNLFGFWQSGKTWIRY